MVLVYEYLALINNQMPLVCIGVGSLTVTREGQASLRDLSDPCPAMLPPLQLPLCEEHLKGLSDMAKLFS